MQVTTDLNLAFPVGFTASEPRLWAYHTPLSMQVFEAHYRIFAATKQAIFGKSFGYAYESGPRIARLELLDAGKSDAIERGLVDERGEPKSSAPAILAEIRRLTQFVVAGDHGFDLVPSEVAIARDVLSQEEWNEVESAIVFFTVVSVMSKIATRGNIMASVALIFGGSMTSLAPLDYVASLKASTPASDLPIGSDTTS